MHPQVFQKRSKLYFYSSIDARVSYIYTHIYEYFNLDLKICQTFVLYADPKLQQYLQKRVRVATFKEHTPFSCIFIIICIFVLCTSTVDYKNSANFLARRVQVSALLPVLAGACRIAPCFSTLLAPGCGRQAGGLDRSLVSPAFECVPHPDSLSSVRCLEPGLAYRCSAEGGEEAAAPGSSRVKLFGGFGHRWVPENYGKRLAPPS